MAGIISDNLGRSSGLIKAAGGGGVNTPAFRAYASSSNQTVSNGADTVVVFDAESFDTAGEFASNVFTPQTSAKYFLNANVIIESANDAKFYVIYISKNGTLSAEKWYRPGSSGTIGMSISTILAANGSSDYFDVQVYIDYAAETLVADVRKTFFEGFKIIE